MCRWCLAYCTGVVLNTVRESAAPDSKENKQADVGSRRFRRHFLRGALLCNFSSTERARRSIYTCPTGMFSGTFYAQHSVTKNLHISPRLSPTIFYQDANSVLLLTSTLLYSSIIRLYQQNPVFKIVHDESVKVYLPMYNGNVKQSPLCVESCVTKKSPMSPLFSSTIFDPDAN